VFRKLILIAALLAHPALAARPPAERLQAAVAAYGAGRFDESRHHFKRLADSGSAIAETMLGVMYANGQGVARDPATAATYFYRAANRGYAPAQLALSRAFADGSGTPKDMRQAYLWARLAVARGDRSVSQTAAATLPVLGRALSDGERTRTDAAVRNWRPWASMAR
jgi:TPR repeat protein